MSAEQNLNEHDNELLSAYLDNALTDDERRSLETRLASEPALMRQLSALRQTIALVRGLPVLKAPRDFVLTADMLSADTGISPRLAAKRRTTSRSVIPFPVISFMSAAASMALIFFGFILIVNQSSETSSVLDEPQASVALDSNTFPNDEIALFSTKSADRSNESDTMMTVPMEEAEESAGSLDLEDIESEDSGAVFDMDDYAIVEGTPSPNNTIQLQAPAPAWDEAQATTQFYYGTPTATTLTQPALGAAADSMQSSAEVMQQNGVMGEGGASGAASDADRTEEMRREITEPEQDMTEIAAQAPSVAADSSADLTDALENVERESGVFVPQAADTASVVEKQNTIDSSPAGLIMIAAGLLLAIITLLLRRIQAASGHD